LRFGHCSKTCSSNSPPRGPAARRRRRGDTGRDSLNVVDAASAIAGCPAQRYSGAHRSLRVRVGRAGTRVAATGLGQVSRMSAVSCGYHEREVQPLLKFGEGVAETAVPMGGVLSHAHCERRSERGEGCGGGGLTYRTTRAPSCTGRLPPDLSRAGSAPPYARGAPTFSPRRGEPRRRGGAPARSPRAGQRTAAGAARVASSPASTVACRSSGSS
jgi:hypothetical protein